MMEDRTKAELVRDYLEGTPNIFACIDSDGHAAFNAYGGENKILLLWGLLSQHICETAGYSGMEELISKSAEAALFELIEKLNNSLKED